MRSAVAPTVTRKRRRESNTVREFSWRPPRKFSRMDHIPTCGGPGTGRRSVDRGSGAGVRGKPTCCTRGRRDEARKGDFIRGLYGCMKSWHCLIRALPKEEVETMIQTGETVIFRVGSTTIHVEGNRFRIELAQIEGGGDVLLRLGALARRFACRRPQRTQMDCSRSPLRQAESEAPVSARTPRFRDLETADPWRSAAEENQRPTGQGLSAVKPFHPH